MQSDINDMLNQIGGGKSFNGLSFSITGLLKFPLVIILFGNILYAILLYLRSKILADTIESSQSGVIKTLISVYLVITIIGSILAVLFLLVG